MAHVRCRRSHTVSSIASSLAMAISGGFAGQSEPSWPVSCTAALHAAWQKLYDFEGSSARGPLSAPEVTSQIRTKPSRPWLSTLRSAIALTVSTNFPGCAMIDVNMRRV